MFFARNHERTMAAVQTIVAFNETLPNGKKLLGIKFDVEPYGSKEWKAGGDQRKQVMRDYLSYLNQVKLIYRRQHRNGIGCRCPVLVG